VVDLHDVQGTLNDESVAADVRLSHMPNLD
jgi:hypothetical protein